MAAGGKEGVCYLQMVVFLELPSKLKNMGRQSPRMSGRMASSGSGSGQSELS